jgi:hypothetical protein
MDAALAVASQGIGPHTDYVTNGYAADNNNEDFNYADKLGDICRHINPDYRLPRAEEFGVKPVDYPYDWTTETEAINAMGWYVGKDDFGNDVPFSFSDYNSIFTVTDDAGTSVVDYDTYGVPFFTYRGIVVFPVVGSRDSVSNGIRWSFGQIGAYLSSSVSDVNVGPTCLAATSDFFGIMSDGLQYDFYPIRCIKN